MDANPTQFPGKRRPAAAINTTKKERDHAQPSTRLAAPTRPKRAFGVARSGNIPTEKLLTKPVPAKAGKPWKPSGNGNPKPIKAISEGIPDKPKGVIKHNQQICFQKPAKEVEGESAVGAEKNWHDGGVQTPMSSVIKSVAATGTPFQTAETCSECRLDTLEMSAYWLAQIKIAESAGKHFVSAAFFRLAFECQAQPFCSLERELKHYVARHGFTSSEVLWSDLCKFYDSSKDQACADLGKFDAGLVKQDDSNLNAQNEANRRTLEEEFIEFNIIDNPQLHPEKETMELIDTNVTLWNDDLIAGQLLDAEATDRPPKDEPVRLRTPVSSVPSRKSLEKSKTLLSNHSSSASRTQRSGGSSDKARKSLTEPRPGSKVSGGKQTRRIVAGSSASRSSQVRKQANEEKKTTSSCLSNNVNVEGILEDATAHQDQQDGLSKPLTSDCQ